MQPFVHLRVHSDYSLGVSNIKIKELISRCMELCMPALCLADKNMFGTLEFAMGCVAQGIQPIIGCSLNVDYTSIDSELSGRDATSVNGQQIGEVLFIVKSREGYENLMQLCTRAYTKKLTNGEPSVEWDWVIKHTHGLIVLCSAHNTETLLGNVLRDHGIDGVERMANIITTQTSLELFFELTRYSDGRHLQSEKLLISLAYKTNIPLVATHHINFLDHDTYESCDVLLCIINNRLISEQDRPRTNPEHYYKTPQEMMELFSDLPEAIENTILIAQKCHYIPEKQPVTIPQFDANADTVLEEEGRVGLEKRLSQMQQMDWRKEQQYYDRFAYEMDLIKKMGFSNYFLIVSDFIKWSKSHGIAVGPGRGSGAGSVLAWSLCITELDPIRFDLIFERFLNPERISMPDFDIDFCQLRRDEVVRYVKQKYGGNHVAHIITFGKLQARAVLRDVGRVLQMPYGLIDRICKMVPQNQANPITLHQAIDLDTQMQQMRDEDPTIDRLISISLQLEGCNRHTSTHAAGIIISQKPVVETMPLYRDQDSGELAGQFSMKYVEAAGLVKFDFLGLKTLTVISNICSLIGATTGEKLDIYTIPTDDAKTYKMLSDGEVTGVFQLEGAGMREAVKQMKPDVLTDVTALTSLYRPGPMDNIPTYVQQKHGKIPVQVIHPKLRDVLRETYGIIVYQEQVMKIAQVCAGYSLGEADVLRSAMGKKNKVEMARQRDIFISGCIQHDMTRESAIEIYNLIEKFASYGFNRAHAMSYALVTYQTAYLKRNHIVEFLVASINLEIHSPDKISTFCSEAKKHAIELCKPSINESMVLFDIEVVEENCVDVRGKIYSDPFDMSVHSTAGIISANDRLRIRYGLGGIKGTGIKMLSEIVVEREKNGKFKDFWNFIERTAASLNKRLLEQLIKSGALEELYPNGKELLTNIEKLIIYSQTVARTKKEVFQQSSLLSLMMIDGSEMHDSNALTPHLENTLYWQQKEKIQAEYDALGFYFTMHPVTMYVDALRSYNIVFSKDIHGYNESKLKDITVAGVVKACKIRSGKGERSGKYAFLIINDPYGDIDISVFDSNIIQKQIELLDSGQLVFCRVTIKNDMQGSRILLRSIRSLIQVIEEGAMHFTLVISEPEAVIKLREYIFVEHEYSPNASNVTVSIVASCKDGSRILFKSDKPMRISYDAISAIAHIPSVKIISTDSI